MKFSKLIGATAVSAFLFVPIAATAAISAEEAMDIASADYESDSVGESLPRAHIAMMELGHGTAMHSTVSPEVVAIMEFFSEETGISPTASGLPTAHMAVLEVTGRSALADNDPAVQRIFEYFSE